MAAARLQLVNDENDDDDKTVYKAPKHVYKVTARMPTVVLSGFKQFLVTIDFSNPRWQGASAVQFKIVSLAIALALIRYSLNCSAVSSGHYPKTFPLELGSRHT